MKINEVLIIAVGFIVMLGNTFADQSMRHHISMIGIFICFGNHYDGCEGSKKIELFFN